MFELKPLHPDSILTALEKATRYRLLGESGEAESICLDVLRVVPDHPQALVSLTMSLGTRQPVAADVRRQRTRTPVHPPPHVGGYDRR